jgi:hypothetical protein
MDFLCICVHFVTYIVYAYKEREHDNISLSGKLWGGGRETGNVKRVSNTETLSVYEDNLTKCTVCCCIIGEQGIRERVCNGGGNLVKIQCLHV